jgi:Amidohydrolase family
LIWTNPVSFVNARVVTPEGSVSAVRFASDVLALDSEPRAGDSVVDLDGAFVFPGLINAHDHLELNHYGRLRPRERYRNATEWIDDLRPLLSSDRAIKRNTSYPLRDRLFIGVLKNVLAGVTTVAHHNPLYRELAGLGPIRIVGRYGWAHSFALERRPVGAHGEPGGDVGQRYRSTPCDAPFVVHLAEGTDAAAAAEFSRFESLGCLQANAVMVHGVALAEVEWRRVVASGGSLVWCPASNQFLFGCTPPISRFLADAPEPGHVCLGTDSRITGARDLLDELRVAAAAQPIAPGALLRMVTTDAARALRLPAAGRIAVGAPADLIVVPALKEDPAEALLASSRSDLALVVIGGRPSVGSPAFRSIFSARRVHVRSIAVDGVERIADSQLAAAMKRCGIEEPGVACLPDGESVCA